MSTEGMQQGGIGAANSTEATARQKENALPFEAAMAQLEGVVRALESGDLPLEHAIAQFQTGMQLVKLCRDQLEAAEQKVEMVLASDQGLTVRPFEVEES